MKKLPKVGTIVKIKRSKEAFLTKHYPNTVKFFGTVGMVLEHGEENVKIEFFGDFIMSLGRDILHIDCIKRVK